MTTKTTRATEAFEEAVSGPAAGRYVLRLFVAGATDRSRRAVERARELCETELAGRFVLEVIDVYRHPILARDGQIVATPTLVREFPRPVRRLIGNLSNTTGMFVGMDFDARNASKPRGTAKRKKSPSMKATRAGRTD